MKDKRLLYILLPAVMIIWIMIGYRLYSAVKGDDYTVSSARPVTIVEKKESGEPDQLQLNYADPFLKKEKELAPVVNGLASAQALLLPPALSREVQNVSSTINWNALAYFGMIENTKTTHRVGIVTLNGVRKLVRESDRVPPFAIEKILKDSVKVRSGQETKYIIKQGRIEWLSQRP